MNLLTSAATVALLLALTMPARHVLHATHVLPPTRSAPVAQHLPPAPAGGRLFGVYVDPWHVDDWARAVGAAPRMVAKFEAFSRARTIDGFLTETERQGVSNAMVSWEPWDPVPAALGTVLQFLPQLGYRNSDIAKGAQDAYITRFARSLARFRGTVWLRYAHEMNGFWYPWSHGPAAYRRAWRHVVTVVRAAGARNVRFVWSPNPNLFEPKGAWLRALRAYWPGRRWVDAVGSTMINFGGRKRYPVRRFEPRLRDLRRTFRRPVLITEANTELRGRVGWLRDLRRMLREMPWIRALAWSQLPSRGTANMQQAGQLNWDVARDRPAAAVLRAIVRDGAMTGEKRARAVSRVSTARPAPG